MPPKNAQTGGVDTRSSSSLSLESLAEQILTTDARVTKLEQQMNANHQELMTLMKGIAGNREDSENSNPNMPHQIFDIEFNLVFGFLSMEDEGDVATAFTLARILSNIPASRGGPTSLVTFDIHALQERFYFGDTILPCFESGIPLLKNRLQALPDSDNISIAFPDDGAWKRFHKQLQHYPTIVCNKVRMGDKRIVRIKEGDAEGKHVVIVDDLVQSGGTLIECQKVLAAHGAAKISAYVTHGIFPKSSWKRFKLDTRGDPAEGFSYFWITDSCGLTVKEVMNKPPFEVLSLAGSIASALQV